MAALEKDYEEVGMDSNDAEAGEGGEEYWWHLNHYSLSEFTPSIKVGFYI
jgi:hypothetical protein